MTYSEKILKLKTELAAINDIDWTLNGNILFLKFDPEIPYEKIQDVADICCKYEIEIRSTH
jgi:hypothetical protein